MRSAILVSSIAILLCSFLGYGVFKSFRVSRIDEIPYSFIRTKEAVYWTQDLFVKFLFTKIEELQERLTAFRSNETEGTSLTLGGKNETNASHTGLEKLSWEVDNLHGSRFNYALQLFGARIIYTKAKPVHKPNFIVSLLGLEYQSNPPEYLLSSHFMTGICFGFSEHKAEVLIELSHEIFIDAITINHIPKEMSPKKETSSAPKHFKVYGLKNPNAVSKFLGDFEFRNYKPKQTFRIITKEQFKFVLFEFLSNHGNPNYTCVYPVEVYGNVE